MTQAQGPSPDAFAQPAGHPAYTQTVEELFRRLPMYQRQGPMAYKKDLGNIRALCQALGRPHHRFRSIHIAGTNGKGSVAHGLASVLQASGYKIGLYTSPHLKDFRERIRCNGQPISEADVVGFVERNKRLLEQVQASFFEVTVAMAFERFAAWNVDVAVVETGLGGRLDSTNILHPLLSVITSIGLDHQQFLGNTLPLIAREKAGIAKPAVPLVLGAVPSEAETVIVDHTQRVSAPLYRAEQAIRIEVQEQDFRGTRLRWIRPGQAALDGLHFALAGEHQVHNLRCILQAGLLLEELGLPISDAAWREGLLHLRERTGLRGRWDILQEKPWLLVDGAHNREGLRAMRPLLDQVPHKRLHVVTASVADKDLDMVLPEFPAADAYYFARPDIPRGLDAFSLQQAAARHGLHGAVYPSVVQAIDAALDASSPEDAVLVCGSLFAVAEVPFERYEKQGR